jgi:hypothetical protein
MPTAKQLSEIDTANIHLFGWTPEIVGYPEVNQIKDEIGEALGGKTIGTIEFDTKSNELVMTLKNESKE